ncbi:MAG: nickel pincer cofactor biosynthesis protein LarC [Dehalococcoidia bacterium]|nr:MAG: nickel pincer cofactor biosynthesis protein LarC [Dehalococcoidia bacterium]
MKIGYLDCFSGLSGDMILGALLDAGLPLDMLTAELAKLPLTGYRLSAQPVRRGIITGTQVEVFSEGSAQERRNLEEILNLIERSGLTQRVKKRSALIFERLATAEAKVHRLPIEEVHFHEVGAVDAIVDVVGAVLGLDLLGIEALFSSPLPSGSGTVQTEQGVLPVPAPATLELIAMAGAPIRPSPSPGMELVTPTGAAIVTTLASFESPIFSLERIGYGVGFRDLPTIPNVLPLWIGEKMVEERQLLLLETNIDDMSPELHGHVLERLFEQGALDVWFTPIQMKKNRPAVMLSVIAPSEVEGKMVEAILRETSTLGLRVNRIERHEAEREIVLFDSSLGKVMVKVKLLHGARIALSLEFEDCRRLAQEHNLPLQEVYRIVTAEASTQLLK